VQRRLSGGCLVSIAIIGSLAGGAASAAPIVAGRGLQREFVWHTGAAGVSRLPDSGTYRFELVNRPICQPGETPGSCFDPGSPVTVQNQPTALVMVRDPDSPALDTLFASEGADAIAGPNELQPYALDGTTVVSNPDDDPRSYVTDPLLTDRQRANPFRGSRTPTANALIAFGGQTGPRQNNELSYRWTQLDDQRRDLFPNVVQNNPNLVGVPEELPYAFDLVDPRIARDTNGDGLFDDGQAFAAVDYPNAVFVKSPANEPVRVNPASQDLPFGGDFTGIIPCVTPDTSLEPIRSAAQSQILTGGEQGCWTNTYGGVIAPDVPRGRNIANAGGRAELPLRPGPDRSNRDPTSADAAQGLDHAAPSGLRFARNVDTVSGRPLIAEGLRGAVNSGRCRNGVPIFVRAASLGYPNGLNAAPQPNGFVVESGDPDATLASGEVAYWNSLSPMTGGLGVGTDPDCLKPGGASGFPNANLLNDTDPVDVNGDTIADPIYNAAAAGLDANGDGDFTDPGLDANGDGDFTDPGDVRPDSEPLPSPQNALQHHHANQNLFAWLCELTLTNTPNLDGSSCLATLFGSLNPLFGAPPTPGTAGTILSETFSATFAGEAASAIAGNGGLLSTVQFNQKGAVELPVPIRPANRDLRDGFLTSLGGFFNADTVAYNADSTTDLLSLDSVLTAEQRALLGCGPFYGTRCDSSRRDRSVGLSEGGGIDLLNTEASALLQWPGLHGTVDGWTTTSYASPTSLEPLIQPGTIGFANEAYCTRYDPSSPLSNDAGLVRLPGCRGISQLLTQDLPSLAPQDPIEFLFEAGYDPQVDGCVLGVSNPSDPIPGERFVGINGHPVRALRVRAKDDPSYDPNDPVGSREDITARLDVTCGGHGPAGTASTTRLGTPAYATNSLFQSFAQTLWHPLAGCKTWAGAHDPSDAVRRCEFTTRDIEQEFIEGTAQIFRSEIAAISWNFLNHLVVTSCDSVRGGDDLRDPECFDPRLAGVDGDGNPTGDAAWAPGRCSLAAPQYCRNVQVFLELTLDENRNGVPDVIDSGPTVWLGGDDLYSVANQWTVPVVPCNRGAIAMQVEIPDTGSGPTTGAGVPAAGHDVTVSGAPGCAVATLGIGSDAALVVSADTYSVNGALDLAGTLEGVGGSFSAAAASFIGDRARAAARAGSTVAIPATSHSSRGLTTDSGDDVVDTQRFELFAASGPGSLLDLSSLASLDAGFAPAPVDANAHEVRASDGGVVDLSSLATVTCPEAAGDSIGFFAEDGSRIDLSALGSLVPSVPTGAGKAVFRASGTGRIDLAASLLAPGCPTEIQLADASVVQAGDVDPQAELAVVVQGDSTLTTRDLSLDFLGSSVALADAGATLDVQRDLEIADVASVSAAPGATIEVGRDFRFENTDEAQLALEDAIVHFDGPPGPRQLLEVGGFDAGCAGLAEANFGIGQLVVGAPGRRTQVRIVDRLDNGNRASCESFEALYLHGVGAGDGLVLHPGSRLIINHLNVYASIGGVCTQLNSLFGEGVSEIDFGGGKLARSLVDTDVDGVLDPTDNCWREPNTDQVDVDCNRVGNVCECGDMSGDGITNSLDARLIQQCDVGSIPCTGRCNVTGASDGTCNSFDARLVQRMDVGSLSVDDLLCAERPEPISPDPPLPLQ